MEPAQNQVQLTEPETGRNWFKVFVVLILLLIVSNLVVIDYLGYLDFQEKSSSVNLAERVENIDQRVEALALRSFSAKEASGSPQTLVVYPTQYPTPSPKVIEKEKVVEKVIQQAPVSLAKEFYVPLGSATVRTEDFKWVDTGAEADLDLANYPNVKAVYLEATLSVPAGQVEVRLYNVSDGHAVAGGQLVGDGSAPKLYRSGSLNLAGGSNTYRIQMRTSLNFTSTMDNARLKIELN